MNDPVPAPEIQTPPEFQFYVQQNGIQKTQREFERDSIPGLQKSLSKAHDNLQRQMRINTQLYGELTVLQGRVSRYRGSTILLTSIVSGLAWEGLKYLLPIALRWLGVS